MGSKSTFSSSRLGIAACLLAVTTVFFWAPTVAAQHRVENHIYFMANRAGKAFRDGIIQEKMDGSLTVSFGRMRNCSADDQVDFVLKEALKGLPDLADITANYRVIDHRYSGFNVGWYGDLANGDCDVLFERGSILKTKLNTTDDAKTDFNSYWAKNLIAAVYIEEAEASPHFRAFATARAAYEAGYERVMEDFQNGVGENFVWFSFSSDRWLPGDQNEKAVCYLSEFKGVISEMIRAGVIPNSKEVKYVGNQRISETNYPTLNDMFAAAQREDCGNMLLRASDAKLMADAFDQRGRAWELGLEWVPAANFDGVVEVIRARHLEVKQRKQQLARQQAEELQQQQQQYNDCTANPECKAKRDRQLAAERQKQADEAAEFNRRYPYVAKIDCRVQGQAFYWAACFDSLRIVSDNQTKVWSLSELTGSAHADGGADYLSFDLTERFQLAIQSNGKPNVAVNVAIEDRRGNVVFQDQKDNYGVIRVGN